MSDAYATLREHWRKLERLREYGCTNHGCKMVRRDTGGMKTNGPCHCIEQLSEICLDIATEADRVKRMFGAPLRG